MFSGLHQIRLQSLGTHQVQPHSDDQFASLADGWSTLLVPLVALSSRYRPIGAGTGSPGAARRYSPSRQATLLALFASPFGECIDLSHGLVSLNCVGQFVVGHDSRGYRSLPNEPCRDHDVPAQWMQILDSPLESHIMAFVRYAVDAVRDTKKDKKQIPTRR